MDESPTSEPCFAPTLKMAFETPESRLSEAHNALSSARALSTANPKKIIGLDGVSGGQFVCIGMFVEVAHVPYIGFGRFGRRFVFVFVFVVGGHQGLCGLEKDVLSARGYVRVCLVGTATPFDEPCGPCHKGDVVGRLLCYCCCCRRFRIISVGLRFVEGIAVGEQVRDDVRCEHCWEVYVVRGHTRE